MLGGVLFFNVLLSLFHKARETKKKEEEADRKRARGS